MARAPAGDERDGFGPAELVDQVRAAVVAHVPADPREARAQERFLAGLDELERPFDPEADRRHVTASAVVVGRRGTVLHRHKRLRRWLQPGGHLEAGEAPWEAARRESEEETGLALAHPASGPRLIHLDVHDASGGHEHLDLRYLLVAEDRDPVPPPGESQDVRWFTWAQATAVADEALLGALAVACRQPEAQPAEPEAAHVGPAAAAGTVGR